MESGKDVAGKDVELPAIDRTPNKPLGGGGKEIRPRTHLAKAGQMLHKLSAKPNDQVLASTRKLSTLMADGQLGQIQQKVVQAGTTAVAAAAEPAQRTPSSGDEGTTAKRAAAVFNDAPAPVLQQGWLAEILSRTPSIEEWDEPSDVSQPPPSGAGSLPARVIHKKQPMLRTNSGAKASSASTDMSTDQDGAPQKKYGALALKLKSTIQATLLIGPLPGPSAAPAENFERKSSTAGYARQSSTAGFAEWKANKQAAKQVAKESEASTAHKDRRRSVVVPRRSSVFFQEDADHPQRGDDSKHVAHRPNVSREGSFGASEGKRKGHRNAVEVLGKMEVGATWNDDSISDLSAWILPVMPSVAPAPIEREVLHPTADPFKTLQAAVSVNKLAMKAKNMTRMLKALDQDSGGSAKDVEKLQESKEHVRIRRFRSNTAHIVIECKNLRGAYLGSVLDTKVVVSCAEEYISRKGKYYWVVVGQTEIVKNTTNPAFRQSVEVDFEPGQPRLVRCDIFSSETNLKVDPSTYKGGFLLDLQELLRAESGKVSGSINPKPEVQEDLGHMQFDVVRQMRDFASPAELMAAFKRADKDRNRQLDRDEFHNAVEDLARLKRFKITPEGENLAFTLCDFNGDGVLNYSEFIAMVYGRHGSITVMLEKRQQSVDEACETQFSLYRKDLQRAKKAKRGEDPKQEPPAKAQPEATEVEAAQPKSPEGEEKRAVAKKPGLKVREKAQVLLEHTEKARVDWFLQQREARLAQRHHGAPRSPIPRAIAAASPPSKLEEEDSALHFIGDEDCHGFRTGWCRDHKGKGVVISAERGGSAATCNLLNSAAGPCSVRTELPLPSSGSCFFEIMLERDGVQDGGSLDGPYSFGLATKALQTWDGPWLAEDKEEFCCWAVAVQRPSQYDTSWSMVHKAHEITVGEGGKSSVATFSLEGASFSRSSSAASAPRSTMRNAHDVVSFRAANALPRGTSYFEVTLKILGKIKGESLGGKCHIGLCTPAMQERGWRGDWTKDERALEAWTLNDNHAGQLSMAMLGVNDQVLTEQQINHRLRDVFDSFDLDKSGTIDKSELRQALRDLGIYCMDDELQEMFTIIDSSGDGTLDYGEFVMMARSRASTGSIVHGHPETWVLNSFFGVGDSIGVQVDTVRKTATLFKNGRSLGQAFSHLPDVLFPFVTLSQPGMFATLTVSSARSIASRSEIIVGGLLRPWVEGSEFGCGDRMGVYVDMDTREVDMYKNGEHVGKAFERIPSQVYPFVTLCHTGAVALLRWPPQPKPKVIDRMNRWLSQCTVQAEGMIPSSSGSMHIGGPPGVTLLTRPDGDKDVGRRVRLRAVDVPSVDDDEVLGLKGCRIVSPLVEVALLHGPAFGESAEISIPHCSYDLQHLVVGFMAASSVSTMHRNVWQSLPNAEFDSDVGRVPLSASGYFCVLSYQDPALSKDVVEVSYDFQPGPGAPAFQALATLDGLRVPQFGVLRVGGELEGTIHIAPKSCVDPRYNATKGAVPSLIGRGECFEPVTAQGRCVDDEESASFSQTEAFVAHGCTLSLQSLFVQPDQPSLRWAGAPLDLRFKVCCKRLECGATYDRPLWVRGKFSSARGDYEWHRKPFSFDYKTGILSQLPLESADEANTDRPADSQPPTPSTIADDVPLEIGRLPWMKVVKLTDPNTILPFALQVYSSGGATPVGGEKVILAAASEEDRDEWVGAIRCFDSLISGCPATQLMSVQLRVSAAKSDTIGTIHEQTPFAVLAPFSLSVMDHALKTSVRRRNPQADRHRDL